jgi:hypothetical protein
VSYFWHSKVKTKTWANVTSSAISQATKVMTPKFWDWAEEGGHVFLVHCATSLGTYPKATTSMTPTQHTTKTTFKVASSSTSQCTSKKKEHFQH